MIIQNCNTEIKREEKKRVRKRHRSVTLDWLKELGGGMLDPQEINHLFSFMPKNHYNSI